MSDQTPTEHAWYDEDGRLLIVATMTDEHAQTVTEWLEAARLLYALFQWRPPEVVDDQTPTLRWCFTHGGSRAWEIGPLERCERRQLEDWIGDCENIVDAVVAKVLVQVYRKEATNG